MSTNAVTALNAYRDAAAAAAALGDFDTALAQACAAQVMIACTPALSRSAGGGSQSVAWSSPEIDNFIRNMKQAQGATLGIQSVLIEMREPADLSGLNAWPGGLR